MIFDENLSAKWTKKNKKVCYGSPRFLRVLQIRFLLYLCIGCVSECILYCIDIIGNSMLRKRERERENEKIIYIKIKGNYTRNKLSVINRTMNCEFVPCQSICDSIRSIDLVKKIKHAIHAICVWMCCYFWFSILEFIIWFIGFSI